MRTTTLEESLWVIFMKQGWVLWCGQLERGYTPTFCSQKDLSSYFILLRKPSLITIVVPSNQFILNFLKEKSWAGFFILFDPFTGSRWSGHPMEEDLEPRWYRCHSPRLSSVVRVESANNNTRTVLVQWASEPAAVDSGCPLLAGLCCPVLCERSVLSSKPKD